MRWDLLRIASYVGLSLIALVLVLAYLGNTDSPGSQGNVEIEIFVLDNIPRWVHSFPAEGQSLEQALSEYHKVESTFSRLDCIEEVCNAGDESYWVIEHNGRLFQNSLSYTVRPGDKFVFIYG